MSFKAGLLLIFLGFCRLLPEAHAQSRALVTELDNPLAERAVEWQNMAFIAEALQQDFSTALAATDSALLLWEKLDALPEIAKLNRYSALLLARLDRVAEAKIALGKAKTMFQQQKAVYGLALTHFEWGRVCLLANEPDSVLYYTQLALTSWKKEKHDSRIVQAKLQLMYLHARQYNFPEAARLEKELADAVPRLSLTRLNQLDFWFVHQYFSEKQQDWTAYEGYNRKYAALIAEFAAEGSRVASFYSGLEEIPSRY